MSDTVKTREASEASEASGLSGASIRIGGEPGRPIGVSPSPDTQNAGGPPWWPGNKWPPVHPTTAWLPAQQLDIPYKKSTGEFPQRIWGPEHWASVILAEAVGIPGAKPPKPAWQDEVPSLSLPSLSDIEDELDELEGLIEYRPAVMAEAMAQKDAILQYFSGILSFNIRSHPATVYLCTAGLRVENLVVMYWKDHFNRVRPSRLSPKLMPPIDPPGHAAYPSGHATQAHLLARLLEQVMPAEIVPASGRQDGPLYLMAQRIGRNREVLGLHYPSDTRAGEDLATHIDANILRHAGATKTNDLIEAAKQEWGRT